MTRINTNNLKRFTKLPILILALLIFYSCKQKEVEEVSALKKVYLQGYTQGTSYHITYLDADARNFHEEIKAELKALDKSLSLYDSLSVISRVNRNDSSVVLDSIFTTVFRKAQEVSTKTKGAFDITVGPLMRLWGFNNGQRISVTQEMVDSIKPSIGYQKVTLQNNIVVKQNPSVSLDGNGIAQGYTCDLIGNLLESEGIYNYMVEIGGEVLCKGMSPRGSTWKLGINEPVENNTNTNNDIREILCVKDVAVSTSGNYRKFYYHNGKKYSHTIDPVTGFPVTNNLLSVTVVAPNCMTADAYATAFMVMGVVQSIHLLQKLPSIDAYFIYRDKNGKKKEVYTRGFWKYFEKNQAKNKN